MQKVNSVYLGDCLEIMEKLPSKSFDMIYLDPPFFTNRVHGSSTRDGNRFFEFNDIWSSQNDYTQFLVSRMAGCKRVLKETGSIFFHGDHNNVHLARQVMDYVFGTHNFRSEIVWHYKRWSNAKKGLLQQHQNILFFSASETFKWNEKLSNYSSTTNIEQIMQKRARDVRGKAVYATDVDGNTLYIDEKRGVPLGDVWEIPFLNPKARERTGYPTQKPLLLLERIVELTTNEGDCVLDPFCGSGTTMVASSLLKRNYVGIDISPDAVRLSEERLANPVRTESKLLKNGSQTYINNNPWVDAHLIGLPYTRIHRNSGLDALLKNKIDGKPCFIRVQREGESLAVLIDQVKRAASNKGDVTLLIIATENDLFLPHDSFVKIIASPALQINSLIKKGINSKEPKLQELISKMAH